MINPGRLNALMLRPPRAKRGGLYRTLCDGSIRPTGKGAFGVVVFSPHDGGNTVIARLGHMLQSKDVTSAELEAVLHALSWSERSTVSLDILSDSQTVVGLVRNITRTKEKTLTKIPELGSLVASGMRLLHRTSSYIAWKPRTYTAEADKQAENGYDDAITWCALCMERNKP